VCRRHGANRNPHEESTAFTSFGSEFEKTTAAAHPTQPQRASTGPTRDSGLPEVVVWNNVVAEKL
jgi:hypothetical protein